MKKCVTLLAAGIGTFTLAVSVCAVYPWLEEMEKQAAGAKKQSAGNSAEKTGPEEEHQLTEAEKKIQREGRMKNYIAARHDRWNDLTGYGGKKTVEAENIQKPEEKIEKLKSLAGQTDNPDLARDLRNAAA